MTRFYTGMGFQADDPGERLLGSFNTARRGKLLSDYFSTGQTDLGQLAKYDPEAAQQIQAQQKQQGLAKMFADLYAAPEEERPKGIAALLGADLDTGMKAMQTFDQRYAGAGGANGMFAQKVGEDGYIYNAMRDGRMVNTGVKADRQMWFRDNAGMAPELVGKDGNVRAVGTYGAQPAPVAAYERSATPQEGDAVAAGAAELANKLVAAGVAPDQVDSIVQSMLGGNGEPLPQAPAFVPAQAKPAMTQAQILAEQRAQAADSRAERADARAGNADQRAQAEFERKGAAVTGQKPMPVGALKADLEIEDALGASEQVFSLAAKHLKRMGDGSLVVGTPEAWAAKYRTFTNSTTPNDINLTELNADKTAIVNASLRLNKGVQTEGDAQRAVNELMSANDHKTTLAALKRLIEINKRASGLQQRKRELLRQNYGSGQQQQAPASAGGWGIREIK